LSPKQKKGGSVTKVLNESASRETCIFREGECIKEQYRQEAADGFAIETNGLQARIGQNNPIHRFSGILPPERSEFLPHHELLTYKRSYFSELITLCHPNCGSYHHQQTEQSAHHHLFYPSHGYSAQSQ